MSKSQMTMPPVLRVLGPFLSIFTRTSQKVTVTGLSSLPNHGPLIIAGNHNGYLDPLQIGVPLFSQGIPPRFAAKAELFTVPVLGWFLRKAQQIPIHRRGDISHLSSNSEIAIGMDDMAKILEEESCLCIFPEGTFTYDPDGWAMRAKTGISRLILDYPNACVIPVAHWETEHLIGSWENRIHWKTLFRRSARVHVHFGEPLDFSAYRGRDVTKEMLQEIADVIMNAINDELEKLRVHDPASQGIKRREYLWDRNVEGCNNPPDVANGRYNEHIFAHAWRGEEEERKAHV